MIDTARLREIASKATPGEWQLSDRMAYGRDLVARGIGGGYGGWFVELHSFDDDNQFEANAAHIAAFDPPTVLALIDQRDSARALLREALDVIRTFPFSIPTGSPSLKRLYRIRAEIVAELEK